MGLPAVVSDIGKYQDIVTAKVPSFIEVKRNRFTSKRMQALLDLQLLSYMRKEAIDDTLSHLRERKEFLAQRSKFFVNIAPKSRIIDRFLKEAITRNYHILLVLCLQKHSILHLQDF